MPKVQRGGGGNMMNRAAPYQQGGAGKGGGGMGGSSANANVGKQNAMLANKQFGQNFLKNPGILDKIMN